MGILKKMIGLILILVFTFSSSNSFARQNQLIDSKFTRSELTQILSDAFDTQYKDLPSGSQILEQRITFVQISEHSDVSRTLTSKEDIPAFIDEIFKDSMVP